MHVSLVTIGYPQQHAKYERDSTVSEWAGLLLEFKPIMRDEPGPLFVDVHVSTFQVYGVSFEFSGFLPQFKTCSPN